MGSDCISSRSLLIFLLYNGKMVAMLAHSFLIQSSSKLLVTRTDIKAWTSLISGLWFPWPIYMFLAHLSRRLMVSL